MISSYLSNLSAVISELNDAKAICEEVCLSIHDRVVASKTMVFLKDEYSSDFELIAFHGLPTYFRPAPRRKSTLSKALRISRPRRLKISFRKMTAEISINLEHQWALEDIARFRLEHFDNELETTLCRSGTDSNMY